MISPVSSSGNTSPPPPSQQSGKRSRDQEVAFDPSPSGTNSFEKFLAGSVSAASNGLPQFLRKKIAFREASHSESLKGLVSKNVSGNQSAYVSYVNNKTSKNEKNFSNNSIDSVSASSKGADGRDAKYGFKAAEIDLFPKERIQPYLKWSRVRSIGPGLINLGNTCFLNSVLQCLFYTCPLAEYLLAREHSKRCKAPRDEFCGLCILERLMQKVHQQGESVIRPLELFSRLKSVGKHFRPGRQEDSHEFLRLFIETFQKASLGSKDIKGLDPRSKETTIVHRVFGGYLQSTVTCSSCRHVSRTFDQFLDLSLDVNKSDNLTAAFKVFTTPELLSKANRYKCEACHRLVEAHKQFSIYKTPEILTIQLKRFSVNPFTGHTNKLNRPVSFPEVLNISEWISDKNFTGTEGSHYRLFGVIVHEGQSCNSGHYHAFVRNSNEIWYSMNDCSVHQVSLDTVLRQRAYILFYQKTTTGVAKIPEIIANPNKVTIVPKSDVSPSTNQTQVPVKRTMEEKMAAVREASRVYTDSKTFTKQTQPENVHVDIESEDEVPQLVNSSSHLRASSMWHMIPLTVSFNSHPSVASKRIKYNFSNEWRVSKFDK